MTITYPKRTLKKNINRDKLIRAARLLFSARGYQNTQLQDIALEANVHVQTLYRQFKSKDDLAIAAAKQVIEMCETFFQEAPESQSTFEIWRQYVAFVVGGLAHLGWSHKRRQLRQPSSMMNDNFLLIVYSGYEDLLTRYLARDFQLDPKFNRLPRMVASFLWSSNESCMKRCAGLDTDEDVLDDLAALLRESVSTVEDIEEIFSSYIQRSLMESC